MRSIATYRLQQLGLAAVCGATTRVWLSLMHPGYPQPSLAMLRQLGRRFAALLRHDLDHVARGDYPLDILFDYPHVGRYLRMIPEAVDEMRRMTHRSRRNDFRDLPREVDPEQYPAYYPRNFHWQTDGWFSARAARRFDPLADVFFAGTVEPMRRMAIPPVVEFARCNPAPRVLDLGSCTGHYLAQLRRALPQAELHGIDLSRPFLAHARQRLGDDPGVTFHHGNFEALPFPSASFDVVTGVFLFHELPRDVRRVVAREALRVLRPGGMFVALDGLQRVDAPELRFYLDSFGELFHEPYHKGYTQDDLLPLLEECGFTAQRHGTYFLAKLVTGMATGLAAGRVARSEGASS